MQPVCEAEQDVKDISKPSTLSDITCSSGKPEELSTAIDLQKTKIWKVIDKLLTIGFNRKEGTLSSFPILQMIAIFLPTQPSQELMYMKEQFAIVNDKLDDVASSVEMGFEQVDAGLAWLAVVDKLNPIEELIQAGKNQLQPFYTNRPHDDSTFLNDWEHFIDFIGPKGGSITSKLNALRNIIFPDGSSVTVEDPILQLYQEKSKNDCGMITPFSAKLSKLLADGQLLNTVYEITQDVGEQDPTRDAQDLHDLNIKMWEQVSDCMRNAMSHAKKVM